MNLIIRSLMVRKARERFPGEVTEKVRSTDRRGFVKGGVWLGIVVGVGAGVGEAVKRVGAVLEEWDAELEDREVSGRQPLTQAQLDRERKQELDRQYMLKQGVDQYGASSTVHKE